jgi:sec-independent protein translocase protein TatC
LLRRRKPRPEARMTVIEHLKEFRHRLLISTIAFLIGGIVAYLIYDHVLDLLVAPLDDAGRLGEVKVENLFVPGVTTAFVLKLKVSVFAGFVLALPVILYQLWRFITPGLEPREKRYAIPFVVGSLALFSLGALFAYLVLPQTLSFLLGFATGRLEPLLLVDQYIRFAIFMVLAFGITFEFPLVLVSLGAAGIVSSARLRKLRRHAIVGSFIVAAVATPSGDPYTMTLMAVPLYVMYEGSLLIIRFLMKK